jgi:hypothetical protein
MMGTPLYDEKGQLLGYFVTPTQLLEREYELARIEAARREAEDRANGVVRTWDGSNGKTTADAIAWLKAQRAAEGGAG